MEINKFKIIILLCVAVLFPSITSAAIDKTKETPPWMEDVKVKGRSTYLVPKGAKREIVGAHVVVEPPNEYVARRIYEIEKYLEERFNKIEKDQDALKEAIAEIKKTLKAIKKAETHENNGASQK